MVLFFGDNLPCSAGGCWQLVGLEWQLAFQRGFRVVVPWGPITFVQQHRRDHNAWWLVLESVTLLTSVWWQRYCSLLQAYFLTREYHMLLRHEDHKLGADRCGAALVLTPKAVQLPTKVAFILHRSDASVVDHHLIIQTTLHRAGPAAAPTVNVPP